LLVGLNGTQYQLYAGTTPLTGGTSDFLSHDIIGIFNGASSQFKVDGTVVIANNPGTNGMGAQVIGAGNGGGGNGPMDGWMGEYIVFPSVLGSTDQAQNPGKLANAVGDAIRPCTRLTQPQAALAAQAS
jgi:hypothetical protein